MTKKKKQGDLTVKVVIKKKRVKKKEEVKKWAYNPKYYD